MPHCVRTLPGANALNAGEVEAWLPITLPPPISTRSPRGRLFSIKLSSTVQRPRPLSPTTVLLIIVTS